MPQISINKNNVFWNFAKILALLDENDSIKLTYSLDWESDRETMEKPIVRWAFGKDRPDFTDRKKTFGDKKPFARAGRTFGKKSFDSDDSADVDFKKPSPGRKTPAYKTAKFRDEKKTGTVVRSANKKWNAGKWYKKSGY